MIAPIRTTAASGTSNQISAKPLWACEVRRGADAAGFCVAGCAADKDGEDAVVVVRGAAEVDGEVADVVVGTGVVPVGLSGNC
jgi:hypothetical protein